MNSCQRCALALTRSHVVPGEGDLRPYVMLVGEAPGANEDRSGRPFAGAAGKILDQMLAEAGMARDDVFITSVLKCRPPKNRDPKKEEIAACSPYLHQQIALLAPRVICPMGNHALHLLLGGEVALGDTHGNVVYRADQAYFPLYHPAAAIYNRHLLPLILDDMRKLKEFLPNLLNR
ncbi:MAG: uracil-DNA glycosylase [Bacillota bacterium]